MLAKALKKLASHQNLTEAEAFSVFTEILEKEVPQLQVAALLGGLRAKGESADEILGCVRVLREKGETLTTKHPLIVDTCGTGGDGAKTFNVSTAAAFVAAGAGVVIAKHGNRSVSSLCGSADVLEALGIPTDVEAKKLEEALNQIGLTFLFAPKFHPTLKKLASLRKTLGFKTIFNIAGPLANPVRAKEISQVVGVFEKRLLPVVAEVADRLGLKKAMVIHSEDGLDEISIGAKTELATVHEDAITESSFSPDAIGYPLAPLSELEGKGAQENAAIILNLLDGEKGAKRDIVVLNAAAAILVGEKTDSFTEAVVLAEKSLDTGKAKEKYEALKHFLSNNKSEVSYAAQ